MYSKGVSLNNEAAFKWYTKAAENELDIAQYALGYMYYYGKVIPQNYKEAVKWYTKAAEQGHAYSQHLLGVMYTTDRE